MDKELSIIVIDKEIAVELLKSLISYLSTSTTSTTAELGNEEKDGEISLTRRAAAALLESLGAEPAAHADVIQVIITTSAAKALQQALGSILGLPVAADASPEDLVRVRISRYVAIELLNAMIINLDGVPAAPKDNKGHHA